MKEIPKCPYCDKINQNNRISTYYSCNCTFKGLNVIHHKFFVKYDLNVIINYKLFLKLDNENIVYESDSNRGLTQIILAERYHSNPRASLSINYFNFWIPSKFPILPFVTK